MATAITLVAADRHRRYVVNLLLLYRFLLFYHPNALTGFTIFAIWPFRPDFRPYRFNYFPILTPIPVLPFSAITGFSPIFVTALALLPVISVDRSTNHALCQATNRATIAPTNQSMGQPINQRTPPSCRFPFYPFICVLTMLPVLLFYHCYHNPVLTGLAIFPRYVDQSRHNQSPID